MKIFTTSNVPEPPQELKDLQTQFDTALRYPIDFSSGTFRFQEEHYPKILCDKIVGSQTLTNQERLKTYNAQYWYRLFKVMQDTFPLLCSTMGAFHFNQASGAYLEKHPPKQPTLTSLGKQFPNFLQAIKLTRPNLPELARFEYLWHKIFTLPEKPSLHGTTKAKEILNHINPDCRLIIQPSLALFISSHDTPASVYSYHNKHNASSVPPWKKDSWINHKKRYWMLLRLKGKIHLETLERWEFVLLKKLKAKHTLEEAFDSLETLNSFDLKKIAQVLPELFSKWYQMEIFSNIQ